MVKILAQRLTDISANAMVLLLIKTFVVKNDGKKNLNEYNVAYTEKGGEKEQKISASVSAFYQPHGVISERSKRDR